MCSSMKFIRPVRSLATHRSIILWCSFCVRVGKNSVAPGKPPIAIKIVAGAVDLFEEELVIGTRVDDGVELGGEPQAFRRNCLVYRRHNEAGLRNVPLTQRIDCPAGQPRFQGRAEFHQFSRNRAQ